MNIEFEELTHQNFSDACNIDRDDIPEDFVDTASTIMNITDYGLIIRSRLDLFFWERQFLGKQIHQK